MLKLKSQISIITHTIYINYRLIRFIYQSHKILLISNFILIIILGILPFLSLYGYKMLIDILVSATQGSTPATQAITFITLLILTLIIIDEGTNALQRYSEKILWVVFPQTLNQKFFSHITQLEIKYFENHQFRNQLEKINQTYNYRPQNLISEALFTIQSLVTITIGIISLWTLNWWIPLVAILISIPNLIIQSSIAQTSWTLWDHKSPYQKKYSYLSYLLQDIKQIKEIKLYNLAPHFINEIKSIHTSFAKDNQYLAKQELSKSIIISLIKSTFLIYTTIYSLQKALAQIISIGDVIYYTRILSTFQDSLTGLNRNLSRNFENSLYVEDIFKILDMPTPKILHTSNYKHSLSPNNPPLIEFKNVTFTYPDNSTPSLQNINLTIQPNQKIAIVGINGAGKSTLIKLLSKLYSPDSGQILVNGISLEKMPETIWLNQLGILSQDFNRYDYTFADNIAFGNIQQEPDYQKIISVSKLSGADIVAQKLPQKYEQMLGKTFEGGIELSSGQWQKIALARAYYRNSPILILDEPTSAIDAESESQIFNQINKVISSKTVILISHRFSTVRNQDYIFVIDNGQIIEHGTHEQLLKLDKKYSHMFKLQAKGYN